MALKFTLEAPFKSMSGVISRKRYPDGRVESVIATKRGSGRKSRIRHRYQTRYALQTNLLSERHVPPSRLSRSRKMIP